MCNKVSRSLSAVGRVSVITCVFLVYAAGVGHSQDSAIDRLGAALQRWLDVAVPEKIYLHTDRDVYIAGETVWLSGYTMDGVTHQPGLSGALYIDLIDAQGTSKVAQVFQVEDGKAIGQLQIPDDLPAGEYQLRAYTERMRHYDEGFVFRRSVRVLSDNQSRTGPEYHTANESFYAEMEIWSDDEPVTNTPLLLRVLDAEGEVLTQLSQDISTSASGLMKVEWPLSVFRALPDPSALSLTLSWTWKKQPYEYSFRMPPVGVKPVMTFFPEGGERIRGLESRVAFELKHVHPAVFPLHGVVKNAQGQVVDSVQTTWEGYGSMQLPGEEGFSVEFMIDDEIYHWQPPAMAESGFSLRTDLTSDGIEVYMRHKHIQGGATLLAHQRGMVLWGAQSSLSAEVVQAVIPADRLKPGVVHLTIFDEELRPRAERLIFVPSADPQKSISVTGIPESIGFRAPISFDLNADSPSRLSVSVADAQTMIYENMDLHNWFLLGSELRGEVKLPNLYNNPEHVDLLLLTHGWRRFTWDDLLTNRIDVLPPWNPGLTLKGNVSRPGFNDGPGEIGLVLVTDNGLAELVTNKDGSFGLTGLALRDSSRITLQLAQRARRSNMQMRLDPVFSPRDAHAFLPEFHSSEYTFQDLFSSMKERLYVDRQRGFEMPSYFLDEVTVTARRIRNQELPSRLLTTPTRVIHVQNQPAVSGKALEFLLRFPSGFKVSRYNDGNRVTIQIEDRTASRMTGNASPLILLDGMEVTYEEANMVDAADIEVIEILRGPEASMYGAAASAGVISLVTRTGELDDFSQGVNSFSIRGYSTAREFYAPDYSINAPLQRMADLRSTLYWNGDVNVNGREQLQFYTGDKPGTWVIRIEGTSADGNLISVEKRFEIKE